MKTTTASGRSRATWLRESLAQSRTSLFEIPVARCGSRTTSTPSGESRRASSWSSGIESESPVTSSFSSGRLAGGGEPIATGSKASGPIGGTRSPAGAAAPASKPPPSSSSSGESPAVSSAWASANGSVSAIHPAGSPTEATMSRPTPGSSSLAARSIEPPERTIRISAATAIATTASRALTLRTPSRSNRLI